MARTTLTETQFPSPGVQLKDFAFVQGDSTSVTTTLSGSMSASAASASVASTSGFSVGDYIQIDSEILLITAISSGFTVTRAQMGTQATSHASSAVVTSLSVGNRFVPSADSDLVQVYNTDSASSHHFTIRGPLGFMTIAVPPSSATGLGFAATSRLPRVSWQIAVDSGAIWINVDDNHLYLCVLQMP